MQGCDILNPPADGEIPASRKLVQALESRHVSMIALGGVIGAGFFVGASAAIVRTGPIVLLSYVLSAVFFFIINLALRDLALRSPVKGSFIEQLKAVLGARLGFVAGWSYWFSWIVIFGAQLIAGGVMLGLLVPLPHWMLSLLLLLLMTGLNLLSVRVYGGVEYWFSITKIFALVLFIAAGALMLFRGLLGWSEAAPVLHNFRDFGGFHPAGWGVVLAVVPTIFCTMVGSEIVSVAAQESVNPERHVQRLASRIALWIGALYFFCVLLILCFVPWNHLDPARSPFLAALRAMGLPYARWCVWSVIFAAILSTLNSSLYVTSRVLLTLADRGDAPAIFSHVASRRRLPQRAVLLSAACAVLVASSAWKFHDGVFAVLLSLTGTLMLSDYFLVVLAAMKLREKADMASVLACCFLLAVPVSMFRVRETRSQAVIGAAVMVGLLAAACLRHRPKSGRKTG